MQNIDKKFFENWNFQKNLIICWNVWVGKTYTAKKLLDEYIWQAENQKVWKYKISDSKFKEFVWSGRMAHKPVNQLSYDWYPLEYLLRCEVILYDDIGVADVTESYIRKLTYILDERNEKNRKHIITTNLTEQELIEKLNERITSRLLYNATVVVMDWPDRRRDNTEIVKYNQF